MNKQDNENINISSLQGEISPQAIELPTGIIRPTGGIIIPTGIRPTGGILPTGGGGILPTGSIIIPKPTGVATSWQPLPYKNFKYKETPNSDEQIVYEWYYNDVLVKDAYIKDDDIPPTINGTTTGTIAEKAKGRYFYVWSPQWYIRALVHSTISFIYWNHQNFMTCTAQLSWTYGTVDTITTELKWEDVSNFDHSNADNVFIPIFDDHVPYKCSVKLSGSSWTGIYFGDLDSSMSNGYVLDIDASGPEIKWIYPNEYTYENKDYLMDPIGYYGQIQICIAGWPDYFTPSTSNNLTLSLSSETDVPYSTSFSFNSGLTEKCLYLRADTYGRIECKNTLTSSIYSDDGRRNVLYPVIQCFNAELLSDFVNPSKGEFFNWHSNRNTSVTLELSNISCDSGDIKTNMAILGGFNRILPLFINNNVTWSVNGRNAEVVYYVQNQNSFSVPITYVNYVAASALSSSNLGSVGQQRNKWYDQVKNWQNIDSRYISQTVVAPHGQASIFVEVGGYTDEDLIPEAAIAVLANFNNGKSTSLKTPYTQIIYGYWQAGDRLYYSDFTKDGVSRGAIYENNLLDQFFPTSYLYDINDPVEDGLHFADINPDEKIAEYAKVTSVTKASDHQINVSVQNIGEAYCLFVVVQLYEGSVSNDKPLTEKQFYRVLNPGDSNTIHCYHTSDYHGTCSVRVWFTTDFVSISSSNPRGYTSITKTLTI